MICIFKKLQISLFFSLVMLIIFSASGEVIVESVNVHPSGDLKAGEKNVSADFQIDFIPVSGVSFPIDREILLSTQLENPIWYYSILHDGIDNEKISVRKSRLTLTGWLLSYNDRDVQVNVILIGDTPVVSVPKYIEVVNVQIISCSGMFDGKIIEQVKNISALVTNSEELNSVKKTESLNVRKSQSGNGNDEKKGSDTSYLSQPIEYMFGIFIVILMLIFIIGVIIWNKKGKNCECSSYEDSVGTDNICHNCGKGNEIDIKFCMECGHRLEPDGKFCPSCGKQNKP